MEFRRYHSSSLADIGSENRQQQTGKLPGLWRTLKAKLDSLGSSSRNLNTAAPLTISPGNDSGKASPCEESPRRYPAEPPQLPAALLSAHASTGGSRICESSSSNQKGSADGPRSTRAKSVLPNVPSGLLGPGHTSSRSPVKPTNIECPELYSSQSASLASTRLSPSACWTNSDCQSSQAGPSSSEASDAAPKTPSSQAGRVNNERTGSEAQPTATKLLAVNPALPAAMARPEWSLDDYTLSKRLYKGSSSAVYRATCRLSGLPVALKIYFLQRVPPNTVHMLKREIEIHSQLVHKHVVRLYGAFIDAQERVVLVQEFASQGDLYGILQRLGGRMLPDQAADTVLRPFLDALAYLHSRGICHRDIKPENILFTGSWRLLMADFGVSIDLNQERAVTRAGTEGYMAPEVERCPLKAQPHDNKDDPRYAYSTAADIWAVGVLAYELVVGFPPMVMPMDFTPADAAGRGGGGAAGTTGPGGGGGDVSGFVRCHMTASELHFPASVPAAARSFISAALSTDPLDRPTAAQLLQHPWLRPPPQPQVQQSQQQMPQQLQQQQQQMPQLRQQLVAGGGAEGGRVFERRSAAFEAGSADVFEGGACLVPQPARPVPARVMAAAALETGGRHRRVGPSTTFSHLGMA